MYPTKQASVRDPAVWVGAGNLLFHYIIIVEYLLHMHPALREAR